MSTVSDSKAPKVRGSCVSRNLDCGIASDSFDKRVDLYFLAACGDKACGRPGRDPTGPGRDGRRHGPRADAGVGERIHGPPARRLARHTGGVNDEQRSDADQLAAAVEEVEAGRGPVAVSRPGHKLVVLVSAEEWQRL